MGSLAGQRVVVTRARHQAEQLARPLRDRGATVLLLPLLAIAPPADPQPLQAAAKSVNNYDWLVFTSANAVDAFAEALSHRPVDLRPKIATIGSATAARALAAGFKATLRSETSTSESLASEMGVQGLRGLRILIPSAAVTRDVLPPCLQELGAYVDVVEAYRNVMPETSALLAADVFSNPFPDWVTFTSSSAADNLVRLVDVPTIARSRLASIGPVTTACIRKHGLRVHAEANPYTSQALAEAMASCNENL